MDWFQFYLLSLPVAFVVGTVLGLIMAFRKKNNMRQITERNGWKEIR